jgi:hypothetical protein
MSGGIPPEVMQRAEFRYWTMQLEALLPNGRPNWEMRRIAGVRICEMVGIAGALQAVAAGGELEAIPDWPEVSCKPVGGGVGFLHVEVATRSEKLGVVRVPIALKLVGRKETYAGQAGEAIERGRWQLRKMIESA